MLAEVRSRRRVLTGLTALAMAGAMAVAPVPSSAAPRSAPSSDTASATTAYTPPTPEDLSSLTWTAAFDRLVAKLSAEYAFTGWKSIDWERLRAQYRPAIVEADSVADREQYYLTLRDFVHQTRDGHVSITPAPDLVSAHFGGSFGLIASRLDDGDVVATWVDPNGPAANGGISVGSRLLRWGGLDIDRALGRVSTVLAPQQPTNARRAHEQLRLLTRGPVGSSTSVTFRAPGTTQQDTAHLVAVDDALATWTMTDEQSVIAKGEYPTKTVTSSILPGNIGYLRVLLELDLPQEWPGDHTPTLQLFQSAVKDFIDRDVEGIVLDIRGNSGGSDEMTARMLGSFYEEPAFYEYQNFVSPSAGGFEIWVGEESGAFTRPGEGLGIEPSPDVYRGPVVALVDNGCVSSCEGLAMGVQRLTRGTVVGSAGTNGSFGMVGDGVLMPGGLVIGWPFGQSLDASKTVQLDSRNGHGGVTPDVWVPQTLSTLARGWRGSDVELAFATRVIREQVHAGTAKTSATLSWAPCRQEPLRGLECSTFTVPKDYGNPGKGVFDLALMRLKANGSPSRRIGTLFINLGGPGLSAVPMAKAVLNAFDPRIRERFDLLLWDPRGVGASAGLTECTGGSYHLPATGPVDWNAVVREMHESQAAANAACEKRYPDVVPYIGTNATVRDLDGMRRAVGDAKLTMWGTSYGTRIGYVYAHQYPDRVRAMLLSSSIDPQGTWTSFMYQSALAPDSAISFIFEAYPGLQQAYLRSAHTLNTQTLTLPSGNELTRWGFRMAIGIMSVGESSANDMNDYIRTVDTALHGHGRAKAAAERALDAVTDTLDAIPMNGGSTPFIGCSDYADRPSLDEQAALTDRIRGQAPITGWGASMGLFYCDGMTITPSPVPVDFTNWNTPMLIIGSTRDSLTPYGWTGDMARTFRNSRVITYVGSTHTAYLGTSACVDRYANDYLLTLKRPAIDAACPNTLRHSP